MSESTKNKQAKAGKSFVVEAGIISVSSFIVKIVGVLFKIPLANILGEHMGVFTAAYSLYAMIYMISTCGLPVAISHMVSASAERGREKETQRIFRVALTAFVLIGTVATVLMMVLAKPFFTATDHPDSVSAAYVIAPSLLFVCVVSAFRGYYQGLRNMYPTAIGQLIEAVFKMGLGLGATIWAAKKGYDPAMQAAFAISGITVGILLEMLMLFVYRIFKRRKRPEGTDDSCEPVGKITREILVCALPATITSSALYLANFIDTILIKSRLLAGGNIEAVSEDLYTAYTSYSTAVADLLPSTLIYPIAISILPTVSAAYAVKHMQDANKSIRQSIRISLIIGLPCCAVLVATAPSCLSLLYVNAFEQYERIDALAVSSGALRILAVGIIFMGILSTTDALLHAVGKIWYPIISVMSGVVCLALIEFFGISSPLGIYAAPISSVCCYAIAAVLNMLFLKKFTTADLRPLRLAVKPTLCAALTCGATYGTHQLLKIPFAAYTRLNSLLVLIGCGIVAVLVYIVSMLLLKGITADEVRLLPLGNKLASFLIRRGWLREEAQSPAAE